MTINGRLLLLLAAMGLFVRVWTANDRPRWRSHARSRGQTITMVSPPIAAAPPYHGRIVACCPAAPLARSAAGLEESWNVTTCPIPLPAGIADGSYRVVDDTGRLARLEIAPSPARGQSASAPAVQPEFYITATGAQRWYFIRLKTPVDTLPVVRGLEAPQPAAAATSIPDTGAASARPACTNRKFDFTGYVNPDPAPGLSTGDAAVEETARPEPPDLPVPA